jgi:hypothetical protein
MHPRQGDQIGRIFVYWVIVYFGWFFLITEVAYIFLVLLSHGKLDEIILTKMGWAALWANFFTNSSGHPDPSVGHKYQISTLQRCDFRRILNVS